MQSSKWTNSASIVYTHLRSIDHVIEDCAKDGGEEFFTEIHWVRITNL